MTLTIRSSSIAARASSARAPAAICLSSVAQLTLRNTRRYGGYVVHFGIVLIFIGISGAGVQSG